MEAVARSGPTASTVRPDAGLFGYGRNLALLLRLHREGPVRLEAYSANLLLDAGLVVRLGPRHGRALWALDHRHPAYNALLVVLDDLAGAAHRRPMLDGPLPEHGIALRSPLGHVSAPPFQGALHPRHGGGAVGPGDRVSGIPLHRRESVERAISTLLADRVLVEGEGRLRLSDAVPTAYTELVRRIGQHLGLDPALGKVGPRPAAFNASDDGAPRLFRTDARLRNLMALAVYGPMLYTDLRRLTGAGHYHLESADDAPFSRGGSCGHGAPAAAL